MPSNNENIINPIINPLEKTMLMKVKKLYEEPIMHVFEIEQLPVLLAGSVEAELDGASRQDYGEPIIETWTNN